MKRGLNRGLCGNGAGISDYVVYVNRYTTVAFCRYHW
jgi:hypothetical protein